MYGSVDRSRDQEVYVGNLDPNPKVAGGGIKILNDHGIETETGILEEECRQLNDIFFIIFRMIFHIQH